MYSIGHIYGFELIPDEFGYWTYASTLSGCDWSDIVSIGSYYSFGYTLILYPIFRLFKDSIYVYRTAVTINFMLMIIAYAVLMRIIMAFRKEKKVSYAALIS